MALITTPSGADATADEVVADIDLTGQCAIVTGALSGIGIETARLLAKARAQVTVEITTTGNKSVTVRRLDLMNRASPGICGCLRRGVEPAA